MNRSYYLFRHRYYYSKSRYGGTSRGTLFGGQGGKGSVYKPRLVYTLNDLDPDG